MLVVVVVVDAVQGAVVAVGGGLALSGPGSRRHRSRSRSSVKSVAVGLMELPSQLSLLSRNCTMPIRRVR